ncbi:hypothetical protein MWU49_14535 [Alcanivorax sp. S6407]|uniref:hypothetical protein n=1 Tax=Alcanivorax sp. S6407 TaxID=2926424 RepID=UPI001FF49D4E|nr:hypothetical protein [Alcanivorax sp. S6407]MCK0154930.1 hypothetical protein [Alcanivorax sp. S6407]
MGFRKAKSQAIACLGSGAIIHEQRGDIDIKNLLATGEISPADVAAIIGRARGSEYTCSPHHQVPEVDVHIITCRHARQDWYIKWYFLEPDCIFISVHH